MWSSTFLLACCLCWLRPLPCDGQVMTPLTSTLLLDSGPPGSSLRNCSCPVLVRDCDEALANSRCRCHTVQRRSLRGVRQEGSLTVWAKEPRVLEELLNVSAVEHLQLSLCGPGPLQNHQLVLLGLRTLRVHVSTPGAPHPTQEVQVLPPAGPPAGLHITWVDLGVLSGLSVLKAFSVIGPPPDTLAQFFPHLVLTQLSDLDQSDPGPQKTLLTFVY